MRKDCVYDCVFVSLLHGVNIRVKLLEGTVTSLLSDNTGNIVGVSYKDKQDDCMKVRPPLILDIYRSPLPILNLASQLTSHVAMLLLTVLS